jgi:hypothetical protein
VRDGAPGRGRRTLTTYIGANDKAEGRRELATAHNIRRELAQRLFEEGVEALSSRSEEAWRQAMRGPLGRDVRLHHVLDLGYQGPADFETRTAPITLLKEFLESIGALESDGGEWWVEPAQPRLAEREATEAP